MRSVMSGRQLRILVCGMAVWLAGTGMLLSQGMWNGDRDLDTLLKQTGLRYDMMENGSMRLRFTLAGDRTQMVIIKKERNTIGRLQLWEAVSFAWKGGHRPSAQIAHRVLADNGRKKIGAWEIGTEDEREYYLIFNAKIPVQCDPASLKTIISAIALGADQMEADITDGDRF